MNIEQTPGVFKRFIRIITFIDLPINRKFSLFSVGVLFWFLALTAVTSFALFNIDRKYSRIVTQTIPHERVTQKIARNLRAIQLESSGLHAAGDRSEVLRHSELAQAYLDDVRAFSSALALGGSVTDFTRDGNRVAESFSTTSVNDSPEGVDFLRQLAPLTEEVARALAGLVAAKDAQLRQHPDGAQLEPAFTELKNLLAQANELAVTFSTHTNTLYHQSTLEIESTIHYTVLAMSTVLLVALILLGIFTHWIADAIALPIRSIISQIHSLGTGDVDLTKKIDITSKDEIGTLSNEFNQLMEAVYGMTTFKNVIEEDTHLPDIYGRLGQAFEKVADIHDFCIYDISDNLRDMHPVFPLGLGESELRCKVDILTNCELCRARKTGHQISSLAYPGVCLQFKPDSPDQQHICLPVNIGGRIGSVVQFLFRPVNGEELDAHDIQTRLFKAEAYLKQSQSVLEAKRLLHTLRESALKDALTGLYNRRFLQENSQLIMAGVKRRQTGIGLLMCDLDYFKQVNDKFGHETGDLLLRETSAVLAKTVRESDFVIRFGGEEFLILLLDVMPGESERVAEKIRNAVANTKVRTGSGTLSKTISIGVSEFPGDTEAFWQAIKYADVALYKAKETGRNKVMRFSTEMWTGEAF